MKLKMMMQMKREEEEVDLMKYFSSAVNESVAEFLVDDDMIAGKQNFSGEDLADHREHDSRPAGIVWYDSKPAIHRERPHIHVVDAFDQWTARQRSQHSHSFQFHIYYCCWPPPLPCPDCMKVLPGCDEAYALAQGGRQ